MKFKLLILNILLLRLEYFHCSNITQVEDLYASLFDNYNRIFFPLINHNNTVNIGCTVGIVSINNFDELSGEIELTMLFYMQWVDERLKWTPSNFGGKTTLLVPPQDVWYPQLYVLQSYDRVQVISNVSIMVRIFANGLVIWNTGNVLKTVCSVDVTYFPFDTQQCSVTVSGWAYTIDEVTIYSTESIANTEHFSLNSQWTLQSATVMNSSSTPSFPPSINIVLTLKRQSDFYVVYIIIPMVFLGSINNLAFIMPANSGERASVAITTFLSFVVFMQMINENVPQSSVPMAYIFYYTLFLLIYSSVIIFLCIVSLRIHDKNNPVPPIIGKILYIFRCWCLKRKRKSIVTPERQLSTVSEQVETKRKDALEDIDNVKEFNRPTVTWKLVGKTFDVYCFYALLFTFWVMTFQTFGNLYFNQGF